MAGNYFSQTGLVTQSLEEIITEITGKYQGIYGNDINIDQNTPDGQMINLLAQMKKIFWIYWCNTILILMLIRFRE